MKDTPDPQLRQQLDALIKKYDEAVNNNDAAALAALFTDDAVFVSGITGGRMSCSMASVMASLRAIDRSCLLL
jgi:uncharacterized protein (TIGR02246 family)